MKYSLDPTEREIVTLVMYNPENLSKVEVYERIVKLAQEVVTNHMLEYERWLDGEEV